MKTIYRIRTVKILALLLAVLLAVLALQNGPLHYWDADVQRITGFRLEAEDSLDVVFLGASDIFYGYSAPYAYEHYGFTSYRFAVGGCSAICWSTMLEETLTRQSPQLVVVEISGMSYRKPADLHNNSVQHFLLDDMPLSPLKLQALSKLCTVDTDSPWCFLFPLTKYHSNWQDLELQEASRENRAALLSRGYSALRGVHAKSASFFPADGIRDLSDDNSENILAPEAEQALLDFLDLCRREDVQVLFLRLPRRIGAGDEEMYEEYQQINRAGRIVQEHGFPFLNLDRIPGGIGLDQDRDYFDNTHMTLAGQQKMTDYLARYLVEERGVFPRPQPEEIRRSWDISAEYYRTLLDYWDQKEAEGRSGMQYESARLIAELDAMKARSTDSETG